MVHAYIMVKTAPGASSGTIDAIRSVDEITEAHVVAGEHDIIAEVNVDDVYSVLQTASSTLQSLDGITETRTYIALD